tara:strand:- start:1043 stop:1489 length:447 start_codon:yes stop_codon:yes gene_type:complete
MEKLETLKQVCEETNVDFTEFVWRSYLVVELGKSYTPTLEQFDDLYVGLVGGVLGNLGSGKTPEYIEGIGPSDDDKNTLESWSKVRDELIYTLGSLICPYDKWIKVNKESKEWESIVIESYRLDKEFKEDPNKWGAELRNKCKSKNNE